MKLKREKGPRSSRALDAKLKRWSSFKRGAFYECPEAESSWGTLSPRNVTESKLVLLAKRQANKSGVEARNSNFIQKAGHPR